jgi:hypothetical protein
LPPFSSAHHRKVGCGAIGFYRRSPCNHSTFYVYRAPSGHLFNGEIEVCGVAGCASVEEVKQAIIEAGQQVDFVVDADTGEGL